MTNTPNPAMSPRELWQQQNDEANDRVSELAKTVTQREWLLITTALDRTRGQIGADDGLTLLSMAWVKERRDHGGASWDRLLNMTDEQLATLHGYPEGDADDLSDVPGDPFPAARAGEYADQIADAAIDKPLGDIPVIGGPELPRRPIADAPQA